MGIWGTYDSRNTRSELDGLVMETESRAVDVHSQELYAYQPTPSS